MIPAHGGRRTALLFTLILSGLRGFSQTATDDGRNIFSFENPKYQSIVVARVGRRAVTAQEFLFNYGFGPAFTRREQDSRHRYLNFMIYEKLLALEGYERRLDTTRVARQSLAEVEGDLATEELYKDDIRSKVRVPGQELLRGMKQAAIQLSVRWLYAPTKGRADTLRMQLRGGTSFDSLFSREATDPAGREERSMETTLFKLHQKNPVLASVVDTMPVHAVSSPIAAPDGYYLVQVANVSTNPLATQSDSANLASDVERALVEQRSDSLSDLYIKHLMEGRKPVIVRKPFDILQTYLAEIVLGAQKFKDWQLAGRLTRRWGTSDFHDMKRLGAETLVELSDRKFTAGEYLDWYHARETIVNLNSTSPRAFFRSLEETVWRMVRDRLLVDRAKRRGLQKREAMKKQMEWWKDKVVYRLARQELADSIRWNDSTLLAFYWRYWRAPRGRAGNTLPFEKAKDQVLAEYYSDELTQRLLHRLMALKNRYGVILHERELNALPIEDEFDPKAIDIYTVKKGGTFPRQAFPSIDPEWQAWTR
jgi:hypothetical protein